MTQATLTHDIQKRSKIVHFYQDNHNFGGVQMVLKNALPALAQRNNYQVAYVGTQDSTLSHALQQTGIPVEGIPFAFKKRSLIKSLVSKPLLRTLDISVYWKLLRILEREKPDLVHIHGGRLEQSLIKLLGGYPLLYTYHGYASVFNLEMATSPWHRLYYKLMRPLFQGLIPFLNGFTVVSQYEQARLYREKFLPKGFVSQVVYNGIDTDEFPAKLAGQSKSDLQRQLDIPPNYRVISFICRLTPNKNAAAFIRLAERLSQQTDLPQPVYFLVAGDGILAEQFRNAFSPNGSLAGHGKYLGFRSDIPQIIGASDITLSTSINEGFGLGVLESVLLGVPSVAYAAGGIPEIMAFEGSAQWMALPNDEQGLFDALHRAAKLAGESLEALKPMLKEQGAQFSLSNMVDAWEAQYAQILSPTAAFSHNNVNNTHTASPVMLATPQ